MEKEIMAGMIKVLKQRNRLIEGHNTHYQAEYLVGAMQMYLLLKPESEADGSWCPPSWVFGIGRGQDFTKESEEE